MVARTVQPPRHPTPSQGSRSCDALNCSQTTREGKPYCPHHVEEHPYVQAILDTLKAREAEEAKVKQAGSDAVDPEGLTARELLLHLTLHGARTVERLSRELQLEVPVLEGYVGALTNQGLIDVGRTHRGSMIVKLSA